MTSETGPSTESASPPVVTPAVRKKLQQCYEHGTKLMQQEKYDFDYAHSILIECVKGDPGNSVYVEAFLQNLQKKYNHNKRGALLAFGGKGPFKKALAKHDWLEVLRLGPDVLKSNPWDVATLRGMAEACAAFDFHEVELRYLKNALTPHPNDPAVNKHCAQSLARIGQFDQAIVCWQRVDEALRGDDEAQRMISDLQIAKTKGHGGHLSGDAARRHAVARAAQAAAQAANTTESAEPAAAAGQSRSREIKLTPRQVLEQDIANRPTDLDAYFQLADLHVAEDRLAEATHVLTKALAASGNQLRVQEKLEDVEIIRKRQQLQIAEKRQAAEPNDAAQQLAHQLREDLNRLELEVYDRRSQRYPQDLELKFQLAMRLKRGGNVREAIKVFQLSAGLASRRAAAALEEGECLQRLKQYDKALGAYRRAAQESGAGNAEIHRLALYRLGTLAEGLKHWDAAEQALGELVGLDPQYKDAAIHLDKLRAIRHKQS